LELLVLGKPLVHLLLVWLILVVLVVSVVSFATVAVLIASASSARSLRVEAPPVAEVPSAAHAHHHHLLHLVHHLGVHHSLHHLHELHHHVVVHDVHLRHVSVVASHPEHVAHLLLLDLLLQHLVILLSDLFGLSHLDVGGLGWVCGQGLNSGVGATLVDGLLGVFLGSEVHHAELLLLGADPGALEGEGSDGTELAEGVLELILE